MAITWASRRFGSSCCSVPPLSIRIPRRPDSTAPSLFQSRPLAPSHPAALSLDPPVAPEAVLSRVLERSGTQRCRVRNAEIGERQAGRHPPIWRDPDWADRPLNSLRRHAIRPPPRPVRDHRRAWCGWHGRGLSARDTRLERDVAIKVLAAHLVDSPTRASVSSARREPSRRSSIPTSAPSTTSATRADGQTFHRHGAAAR